MVYSANCILLFCFKIAGLQLRRSLLNEINLPLYKCLRTDRYVILSLTSRSNGTQFKETEMTFFRFPCNTLMIVLQMENSYLSALHRPINSNR